MIGLHGVSIAYDGTAVINGMSFNIAPGAVSYTHLTLPTT